MKYKYIPTPTLVDDEEAKPLYQKDNDIFIVGWEVGHYVEIEDDTLPDDVPKQKEWVKLREEMTLTPEQEEEWQRQQAALPPTVTARVTNIESGMDGLLGGESDE